MMGIHGRAICSPAKRYHLLHPQDAMEQRWQARKTLAMEQKESRGMIGSLGTALASQYPDPVKSHSAHLPHTKP